MYVCCSIFGHEGQDADDVVFVNWLSMVRAGLLGLEFYTPESKSWRQVIRLLTLTRRLSPNFGLCGTSDMRGVGRKVFTRRFDAQTVKNMFLTA